MAVKPDIDDTRWAEEADGTPSAELTEPNSGKKDIGWEDGELPPHDYFNWLGNAPHQWFKYLDEGEIDYVELFTETEWTLAYPASAFKHSSAFEFDAAAAVAGSLLKLTSADSVAECRIDCKPGDRIGSLVDWWVDADGVSTTCEIARINISTGAVSVLDTITVSASGRQNFPYAGTAFQHVIAAGYWYVLRFKAAGNGATLYGATVTLDHPRP